MPKRRNKLHIREEQLIRYALKWSYDYGLRRKNDWLDLPLFIRGNKTFAVYLENMISESKNGTSQGLAY